jgi:hypothetical protein
MDVKFPIVNSKLKNVIIHNLDFTLRSVTILNYWSSISIIIDITVLMPFGWYGKSIFDPYIVI